MSYISRRQRRRGGEGKGGKRKGEGREGEWRIAEERKGEKRRHWRWRQVTLYEIQASLLYIVSSLPS